MTVDVISIVTMFCSLLIVIVNLIYVVRVKNIWTITKLGYVGPFFVVFLIYGYAAFGQDVDDSIKELSVTLITVGVLASSIVSLARAGFLGASFEDRDRVLANEVRKHEKQLPENEVTNGPERNN